MTGITEEGILTNTSTYGDWVCVAAPSENIRLPHTYGLEQYGDFNGTSCAAPFVTATCAMIKTQYPHLNNEQIKQVLFNSCTKANPSLNSSTLSNTPIIVSFILFHHSCLLKI